MPPWFYYTLAVPIFAATYAALKRLRFDNTSIVILLSAVVLYFSYFFHSEWLAFTPDPSLHRAYVDYIATHAALPSTEMNPAARHPPAYYALAALFEKFGMWAGGKEPIYYARYLSMALYIAFVTLAALTIRSMFAARDRIYYLALAMIAFWPIGVTKSGIIHSDILAYPTEMSAIYFLLQWLQRKEGRSLSLAMFCTGLAMLAKNSAVIILIISSAILFYALWKNRYDLRRFLTPSLLSSIAFAAASSYWTLHHDVAPVIRREYINPAAEWTDIFYMFFYFDPYLFLQETIINPHQGDSIYHFWHYYLRSLLLGDFITWKALAIVFAFGAVWLAVIVYILYGLWKVKKFPAEERTGLTFLCSVAALFTGVIIYMFYILAPPTMVADGRYAYPIITIIAIFFGKAMEWHKRAGRDIACQVGGGLALGFVLLTILLFISQDYVLTRVQ